MFSLPRGARVLDLGCGNDSALKIKALRPDLHYTGVDVIDCSAANAGAADRFVRASPEDFHRAIEQLGRGAFDAVISAHNLEHCDQPQRVLAAACGALKPTGRLYLAFPAEASARFPSRRVGCLNFYDDDTHQTLPNWAGTRADLGAGRVQPQYGVQRYRPWIPLLIGLICEPASRHWGRTSVLGGTWALYGFESVIWGRKL